MLFNIKLWETSIIYSFITFISGGADKLKELLRSQRRNTMDETYLSGTPATKSAANPRSRSYMKREVNVSAV